MCFSAGASFTSGVLLTFVGTETLRKVHKPSQFVFASIPLFFAFQQFAEGVLWLAITQPGHVWLKSFTTYVFLIMAQVIWPIMTPLSVLLMEEKKTRKYFLRALLAIGIAIATYYAYRLLAYDIHAEISRRHVAYQSSTSDPYEKIALFIYLVATLTPLYLSSVKRTYILGIIMTISFIVSAIYYMWCLTSVWCFFAAVISFVIFYIIRDSHRKFHLG